MATKQEETNSTGNCQGLNDWSTTKNMGKQVKKDILREHFLQQGPVDSKTGKHLEQIRGNDPAHPKDYQQTNKFG